MINTEHEWIRAQRKASSVKLVPLSAGQIAHIICDCYGIPFKEIMGESQIITFVRCRAYIYYALRTELGWSFNRIARYIGRDRTTVRSGYLNHLQRIESGEVKTIVFPKGKLVKI